jgi:hypothetical protein
MTYELDLVVPVEDGALEGVLRKVDPKRREAALLESEKTSRLHLHLDRARCFVVASEGHDRGAVLAFLRAIPAQFIEVRLERELD